MSVFLSINNVVDMIIKKKPKLVGVFRLTMKEGSDNFRASAIQSVMKGLSKNNIDIIIYEPTVSTLEFNGYKIQNNLELFKQQSDVIITNRYSDELLDVQNKVYTRDLFRRD